jgi:hypothetical protein
LPAGSLQFHRPTRIEECAAPDILPVRHVALAAPAGSGRRWQRRSSGALANIS